MHGEANWTLPYFGQTSPQDHHFCNFGNLLSPIICAKARPQGLFGSEEEDF